MIPPCGSDLCEAKRENKNEKEDKGMEEVPLNKEEKIALDIQIKRKDHCRKWRTR